MKFPEEIIKMNIKVNFGRIIKGKVALSMDLKEYSTKVSDDRDMMLKQLGVGSPLKKVPLIIQNAAGSWINPYFVAKFFLEKGVPKEMSIEAIAKNLEMDEPAKWWDGNLEKEGWNNWSADNMPGWCDFWYESFKRIPHNILCDSKEYYKLMNQ